MSARLPRTPPSSRRSQVPPWPGRPRRRRPLAPQALELVAIVAFLFLCYHALIWYWGWTSPREVKVPSVVGVPEVEAGKLLEAAGLRPEVVARKTSEEAQEQEVLAADPPPGRAVKVGRRVRLTVSAGSRWSSVPDVREMSVDRARALLTQADLEVGRETARYHNVVPVGYVVGQAPLPEEKVLRGTSVDLVVSKGPAPIVEPVEPPAREGARSTRIQYEVPPGASLQEVRIEVDDKRGKRTVYRNFHRPGETVSENVSGEGENAVVRLFLSGVLAQEKPL